MTIDVTAVAVGMAITLAALFVIAMVQTWIERREEDRRRKRWVAGYQNRRDVNGQ